MAEIPSANTTIDDEAGAFAGGTGYLVLLGCVERNADVTPRVYASTKSILSQHGYSAAVDYAAMHIKETKKPIIFVGLPIATAGSIGRVNNTGVVGTSEISVAAGSAGVLDESDLVVTVVNGGTIGTVGITFNLSLDGGRTEKLVRLGTASSYTVPYHGLVLSFTAGTLIAGDTFSAHANEPMWDNDGIEDARLALAAQQKRARSILVAGEVSNATFAGYLTTMVNAYETSNDRFAFLRASVKDKVAASMAKTRKRMSSASLTFAEVGVTGDTITRAAGSFITDGFAVGDIITVAGSASNNVTGVIATLSALVITLDTTDLVAEGPVTTCTIVGSTGLTFAEVGATGDTITRVQGSWIADGFAVGDTVVITGTASNNITGVIGTLSATVLTLTTADLAAEVIASHLVTIVKSEAMAAYVSRQDTAFAGVDAQRRIDLSLGRARKVSPITGWSHRRPWAWAASIREYQHDVHIPCWRKADGPHDGWSLADEDGVTVEYDERTDGGALAARFTCARTWANGPNGTFTALSLTRATEGSLLSRTHNMAVANVACGVVQAETENAIGQVLVLNPDGTGTEASLSVIEERVNSALQLELLQDKEGEGPRASVARWTASRNDILNVPGATLNGVLNLLLNGTLEKINTSVVIQTAG
jgi:hypothetical protein